MGLKTWVAKVWAKKRAKSIVLNREQAIHSQEHTLKYLCSKAEKTSFGKAHQMNQQMNSIQFAQAVPVRDYEMAKDWFSEAYEGKDSVLWPGKPLYFAKTSGTTSGAKYIPLTKESMTFQVVAARDALLCYIAKTGNASFLDGKMMFLSGSPILDTNPAGIFVGRLSGISNHFVPAYLRKNQVPSYHTNCIEDWEAKIEKIVQETKNIDLRLISGIPPWVQMFFEKVEGMTGKNIQTLWPNLSVYVQGGVDFRPYKPMFEKTLGKKTQIVEVYPASEGFIALQNDVFDPSLLLLMNAGLFYEFIPVSEYGKDNPIRLTIKDVEIGVQYALILSTNAGLWAYDIGDTVEFTSLNPFKIKVSGRVKHFISAFGEHVIQAEVNRAMEEACQKTAAIVTDFTVAPFISDSSSCHEWYIEFEKTPENIYDFARILDESMQNQNIYYKDLRIGNILNPLKIYCLQKNACREYMKSIGKLGGQNKFQRLGNNRIMVEGLAQWKI